MVVFWPPFSAISSDYTDYISIQNIKMKRTANLCVTLPEKVTKKQYKLLKVYKLSLSASQNLKLLK